MLPKYIYRLIDHIYFSDSRSFIYYKEFQFIVNLNHFSKLGDMTSKMIEDTIYIQIIPGIKDTYELISNELMIAVKQSKKILLFSDNETDVLSIIIYYLKKNYHFTNEDIRNLFMLEHHNSTILKEIISLLS